MSDLRAAVEGLPKYDHEWSYGPLVLMSDVLALIPEGAVLVTEETLAAALTICEGYGRGTGRAVAAAILRHLREGT